MGRVKAKKPAAVDLSEKRGLPCEPFNDSWDTVLVRFDDPARPTDSDAVIDRLLERGRISVARRNIGAELFAGKLKAPAGKWALLIKARGQSWLWLAPSWEEYRIAEDLAKSTGLVTLVAGYQDTANATFLMAYDGPKLRVEFESTGYEGKKLRDSDNETRIKGRMHDRKWLKQFPTETEAQEALLKELDAFTPYLGVFSDKGKVGMYAADEEELDEELFERVDLLVFGPAKSLEVGEPGRKLRDAINKGDAAGVRAAVKAGADLTVLPGTELPPLQDAIATNAKDAGRWLGVIRALLEAGADPSGPPGANPPLCALANETFIDLQTLIEGLKALLDHGADVNGQCTDELQFRGSTAVHILAQMRGATPLKFLHSRGVDVLGVKDSDGKTPLQACEASLRRMKKFFGEDFDGGEETRESIEYLKSLQKGTAGDADYEEAAAEDRKAKERKRKEVTDAFKDLGDLLKSAGTALRNPTQKNLASVAVLTQPQEVHLVPASRAKWANAKTRDAEARRLEKEGFERIGLFRIKEVEGARLLAMLHRESNVYGAVCELGKTLWVDLVRHYKDGSRVTVSNAKTFPAAQFSSKQIRKVRLPDAAVAKMVEAMAKERPPKGGVEPVTAGEFVERFERAYREEMEERRGRRG
jgi:hypothetical protein